MPDGQAVATAGFTGPGTFVLGATATDGRSFTPVYLTVTVNPDPSPHSRP